MNMDEREAQQDSLDIAVIGMAGRFPAAGTVDQYWENLCNGVESITFFSDDELIESGIDRALVKRDNYVKAAPIIDGVDMFDASFFGYSPREARFIDPQHRLFLECAWEALEHAGYDPEKYQGRIGVYAGSAINTYLMFSGLLPNFLTDYVLTLTASDKDFLSTRVSYKLNLTGPSLTIQTACSTSLVATHIACQSLLNGECDMALAGGVSVKVPQRAGYLFEEGGILTPDGHCRPFDARAKGTIFGSGAGIIVVKRLAEAVADRDCIYAVIKGSAINNDGSSKATFTAPSVNRQAEAVTEAITAAGINADSISYIETHGTGTILGDPIEIAALTRAFRNYTDEKQFCAVGSVKSNIGHLDAAAGVAGLIKTILALKHRRIPPSLHFEEANPAIDFINSPFRVNAELSSLDARPYPLRAGVNGLGVGGTNAHIILEEAPEALPSGQSKPIKLLLLSSKSISGLEEASQRLADHLARHPGLDLADAAYTLQVGRRHFGYRRAIICKDRDDALRAIKTLDPRRVITSSKKPLNREVVFMFPGQSAQRVNMGLDLYKTEPEFRKNVDLCSDILKERISLDLLDVLYPDETNIEQAAQELNQTHITQPALFTIEYALAKLWTSWGVEPCAFIGHSIGEYVAACLAGVFSLEDALSIVASRGRLVQQMPGGCMLAVPLSESELQPLLDGKLALAAVNGPALCVVSGGKKYLGDFEARLSNRNLSCRYLNTSHAFHSPAMEPVLSEFVKQVKRIHLNAPRFPYISNVTGTWIKPAEATSPEYWARHLRQTVRFSDGVGELLRKPERVMLEVGPGHALSSLVKQHSNQNGNLVALSSLPQAETNESDLETMLKTLGRLWMSGAAINWDRFYQDERRLRVALPTYAFQRQSYWLMPTESSSDLSAHLPKQFESNKGNDHAISHLSPDLSVAEDTVSESEIELSPASEQKPVRVAPRTPVETVVAGVWQEALGISSVGVFDNFFDLGGHSLLINSIISRLNSLFKIDLPSLSIFESPTVADLAQCIEVIYQINKSLSGAN